MTPWQHGATYTAELVKYKKLEDDEFEDPTDDLPSSIGQGNN